jgi:hypothetical protein
MGAATLTKTNKASQLETFQTARSWENRLIVETRKGSHRFLTASGAVPSQALFLFETKKTAGIIGQLLSEMIISIRQEV